MRIIDGKKISYQIKEEIKHEVENIISKGGKPPHLAAVLVGEDGASLTYVGSKVRSCKQVGFKSIKISEMPHGSSQFKNVNTLEDLM